MLLIRRYKTRRQFHFIARLTERATQNKQNDNR